MDTFTTQQPTTEATKQWMQELWGSSNSSLTPTHPMVRFDTPEKMLQAPLREILEATSPTNDHRVAVEVIDSLLQQRNNPEYGEDIRNYLLESFREASQDDFFIPYCNLAQVIVEQTTTCDPALAIEMLKRHDRYVETIEHAIRNPHNEGIDRISEQLGIRQADDIANKPFEELYNERKHELSRVHVSEKQFRALCSMVIFKECAFRAKFLPQENSAKLKEWYQTTNQKNHTPKQSLLQQNRQQRTLTLTKPQRIAL